ncbi:DUF4430 domain-containing protein [Isoptericola rhizosphaerae]|uniref:DUF4430 domain-containing protein n=1 Tax=Isoptericola rhizosphaerae TaxID=3377837 RepID=UPI00383A7561
MKILTRKTPTRLLAATVAGVLSAGLLAGCSGDDEAAPGASPAATEEITTFSYEGADGETALDLLLAQDAEAEVSGEGEMAYVTAVQGHAAEDGEEFWALYVDGEMAQVGAGTFETEDGQQLEWKLEEIE